VAGIAERRELGFDAGEGYGVDAETLRCGKGRVPREQRVRRGLKPEVLPMPSFLKKQSGLGIDLRVMDEVFQFKFGLRHPPSNLTLENLSIKDAVFCILFGTEWFAEFRSKFGHLVLVFQELEQELRITVDYMKQAYEQNGVAWEFEVNPKEATFEMLMRMFADQLTDSDGSRVLIRHLHEARKYRNRLAHQFTNPDSLEYHQSAGCRAKIIQQLNVRIKRVIPLVMVVHRIGRAYAFDVGMSDEAIARGVKDWQESLGIADEDEHFRYVTGEDFESFKERFESESEDDEPGI